MKRTAIAIAALLVSAAPALAAEGMGSTMMDQEQQGQKDECLLIARNCVDHIDSIQQRIDRLNHEIGKGSAVYTNDELRKLNSQLRDAERTLEFLMTNSGA